MWLISLAAVRRGTFLQRDGQGSSTSSPLVLQASNLIRSPGPPLPVAPVLGRPGPGCLAEPEALALHPPPPDAHGAGTVRSCCPGARGGGRGGRGRAAPPHLASLGVRVGPGRSQGWVGGWVGEKAPRGCRGHRGASLAAVGPGWEGGGGGAGPRGSDGGGRPAVQRTGRCGKGGFNINSFGVETEGGLRLRLLGADSG